MTYWREPRRPEHDEDERRRLLDDMLDARARRRRFYRDLALSALAGAVGAVVSGTGGLIRWVANHFNWPGHS